MDIREKQAEIWEQQLILELQVSCQFLPLYFHDLEKLITCHTCSPLNNQSKLIAINNHCFKIAQETKRRCLSLLLSIYEMKLQAHEQQYQQIFTDLKSVWSRHTSLQGELLLNQIEQCINNRTKELKQTITNKIPAYRGKLLRNRQRASLSPAQTVIGISPEPYLDVISNPFDRREWHYLSLGKSIFLTCYSFMYL